MKTYKQFLLEDYWNNTDLDFDNMLNLKKFKAENQKIDKVNFFDLLKTATVELIKSPDSKPHRESIYYVSLGDEINILWNEYYKQSYDDNNKYIYFFSQPITIECNYEDLNRVHFPEGIPPSARGSNLGYRIYRKLLEIEGWLTTQADASVGAKIVWDKLGKDLDVYGVVTIYQAYIALNTIKEDTLIMGLTSFLKRCSIHGELKEQFFISPELNKKYSNIIQPYL
jgi:hypothetical protein